MQTLRRYTLPVTLLIMTFLAACAPVKTLDVWQDPAYAQPMKKVLVIAVAQSKVIRTQFENVLANQLAARGIKTMEDLAEQSVDDLMEIEDMDEERAGQLIMTARAPWFADEEQS